jgi:uncharacterized SAM-binding protein YcdF (DUF218 family)
MIRGLFRLIFKLLVFALIVFALTAVVLVYDGSSDSGDKADVALVTGRVDPLQDKADLPRLDRAIELYHKGEFPVIIVSEPFSARSPETPGDMERYLQNHGVPASAIIQNRAKEDTELNATGETARDVAAIMRVHGFKSVMVITDYYHVTRVKLALYHEGVENIEKAHVGKLDKTDVWNIGRDVVALYVYVGKVYLSPAAEKAKEEAQVGLEKAKVDAEAAKQKVDKSLDSMAK